MLALVLEREERALDGKVIGSPPPLVNTISSGAAPSSVATWPRVRSSAAFAGVLAQWPLDGLPKASSRKGCIAVATAGSIGVLAL
ncbi:hypothetical protein NKH81_26390 [Mesorhizobium sp. M0959]